MSEKGVTAEERAERLIARWALNIEMRVSIEGEIRSAEREAELRVVERVRAWLWTITPPPGHPVALHAAVHALLDSIEHAAAPGSTPERGVSGSPPEVRAGQSGAQPHPLTEQRVKDLIRDRVRAIFELNDKDRTEIREIAREEQRKFIGSAWIKEGEPLIRATARDAAQVAVRAIGRAGVDEARFREIAREEIVKAEAAYLDGVPLDTPTVYRELRDRVSALEFLAQHILNENRPESLRDRVVEAARLMLDSYDGARALARKEGSYDMATADWLSARELRNALASAEAKGKP